MKGNMGTRTSGSIDGKALLPIIIGAILLCAWAILMYFPTNHYPAVGWYGNMDYRFIGSLATVLLSSAIFAFVYAGIRGAAKNNISSIQFAKCSLAVLTFSFLVSLLLMVVPFMAAGAEVNGYNDPKFYVPFSLGAPGAFVHSLAMVWCDAGFYLIISSWAAFTAVITANPRAFTRSQLRLYNGFAAVSAVLIISLLAPWPQIAYWIFD